MRRNEQEIKNIYPSENFVGVNLKNWIAGNDICPEAAWNNLEAEYFESDGESAGTTQTRYYRPSISHWPYGLKNLNFSSRFLKIGESRR